MLKLENIKMKPKLVLLLLIAGLLPLIVVGFWSSQKASDALMLSSFNQLNAVRGIKKAQIQRFFSERLGDVTVLADNPFVREAMKDLDAAFEAGGGVAGGKFKGLNNGQFEAPAEFKKVHDKYYKTFKFYMDQYGYYDIFLMCPDHGDTSFTVSKESDFGRRAKEFPSGLADAWQIAAKKGEVALSDTKRYPPSNNLPNQFVAAPIKENGEIIGVVALQVSLDAVNAIMGQRNGMGKTGETYLIGLDKLMRSDSFLDPNNHSVTSSFANPEAGKVETLAATNALAGKTGSEIVIDYNGNSVLSSYAPVKVGNTTWALLAEIDEAEIREPVNSLLLSVAIVGAVSIAFIILFALIIATKISSPLERGVKFAQAISAGDLTQQMKITQKDEIGLLGRALNEMAVNLRTMFQDISTGVQTLSSTSTQLSAISEQMSVNADQTTGRANTVATAAEEMSVNMESVAAASEETSVNVNMVASAAEEMSSTITEISANTDKTQSITTTAVTQSQNASTQINELGSAALEVGKVTETITEISEQTNLLALNATIEAARAGEAGKGFAVVANEIKDLAKQTSDATGEIKEKISKIQEATKNSVTDITQITSIIGDVNEMVSSISVTIEEQANATQEIAENVSQASQGIQEVNENVAQVSSVTREVAADISKVGHASTELNESSEQVNVSAGELSKLAEKLTNMVNQFKV